ncbi:DUF4232 domain-containing protein [Streptomyces gobitricini]|uniref:DUF4232 domain-containing protein n=1 Tax=Streptomyces gobitricini TaxID=68211 RepID=A0ABN3MN17_9ACTN
MAHINIRGAALVSAGLLALTAAPALATAQPTAAQIPCRTADLGLDWTTDGTAKPGGSNTEEQVSVVVAVKNSGSSACTLRGFPKVTLKMGTETKGVETETFFNQQTPNPKTVTLNPGGTARFTMTFLSGKTDDNVIDPGVAAITPPGNTQAKELRWIWGMVQKQEAATHPLNYVGPLTR